MKTNMCLWAVYSGQEGAQSGTPTGLLTTARLKCLCYYLELLFHFDL